MWAIAVSFAGRRPISGRRQHGWQHADTAETAEAHSTSSLPQGAGGARSRRPRRRRRRSSSSSSSTDYYPGLHEEGRRLRLRIASPAQVIVEARLAGSAVAAASNAAFNMAANDFLRPPPGPGRRPLSWARPPAAHRKETSATVAPDDASLAGVGFSGRLLSGRRCASRGSHIERHSSFFPGLLRLRAAAVPLSPRRSQRAVSACVKDLFFRLLCSWFLFT